MRLPRTCTAKAGVSAGFTFIEILIVAAIFVVIAGLGLFFSLGTLRGYLHRSERDTILGILKSARSEAMNNICIGSSCTDGKPHGVCYIAPGYVIFQGSTCVAGVSTNVLVPANPAVSVVGLSSASPVVFDQLTGNLNPQLSPPGNEYLIIISESGRPDVTISINNEGTINW